MTKQQLRQRPKAGSSVTAKEPKHVETEKEREDREERELEEWCAKWAGRLVSMYMFGTSLLSMLKFIYEYATRPDLVASVPMVDLAGQTAVITGGCGGMGLHLAHLMLHSGAALVLGCRNSTAGTLALSNLMEGLPEDMREDADVEVWPLELDSFTSVREFAARFEASTGREEEDGGGRGGGKRRKRELHMLVHNAGTLKACQDTEDGVEWSMQVNYLAPFLLTDLLIPSLQATQSASRVVHVTCPEMASADIDITDLEGKEKRCNPQKQYSNAKMATLVSGLELEQRFRGGGYKGITSNVINPEAVETLFHTKDAPPKKKSRSFMPGRIVGQMLSGAISRFTPSTKRAPEHGAYGMYHVATSPALANVGGRLFSDTWGNFVGCGNQPAEDCGRVFKLPKAANDYDLRSDLEWWRRSVTDDRNE